MSLVPVETTTGGVERQSYSMSDLMNLAERIARTAMVPNHLRGKPDEVLATLMYGTEIGLPPMQSLQLVDMMQGKPTLNAQGQRALILGAGHEFWVESSTAERAVVCARRRGSDRVLTAEFTIEDAKERGLVGKDNWRKQPADMLVARATTRMARQNFSDVTLGLAYDADELDDGPRVRIDAPLAIAAGSSEPTTLSADNVQRFFDFCNEHDVRAVDAVLAATNGRTDNAYDVLTTELPALRDAARALIPNDPPPDGGGMGSGSDDRGARGGDEPPRDAAGEGDDDQEATPAATLAALGEPVTVGADVPAAPTPPDPEVYRDVDIHKLANEVFGAAKERAPHGQKSKIVDRCRYRLTWAITEGRTFHLGDLSAREKHRLWQEMSWLRDGFNDWEISADFDALVVTHDGREIVMPFAEMEQEAA